MNKQDRQNKTILKKRERNSGCLPAPEFSLCQCDYWRKLYAVQKAGARQAVRHHASWAQERSESTPRARGKQTSEFCIISLLNVGYKFSEQSLSVR